MSNNITIKDSTLIGAQYDENTINAVEKIAEGLIENAKALSVLASVLKHSNTNFDALIKIGGQDD